MKISNNAKAHVAAQVTEAFADELRDAQKEVDASKKACEQIWNAFKKDVDKVVAKAKSDILKLVKAHGLHFAKDDYLDRNEDDVCDSRLHDCRFVETRTYSCDEVTEDKSNGYFRAKKSQQDLNSRVRKAVDAVLYRIEVEGKKDTVDAIIAEEIGKITKGK